MKRPGSFALTRTGMAVTAACAAGVLLSIRIIIGAALPLYPSSVLLIAALMLVIAPGGRRACRLSEDRPGTRASLRRLSTPAVPGSRGRPGVHVYLVHGSGLSGLVLYPFWTRSVVPKWTHVVPNWTHSIVPFGTHNRYDFAEADNCESGADGRCRAPR